jgi:phosphatidate cytidylyltransferase
MEAVPREGERLKYKKFGTRAAVTAAGVPLITAAVLLGGYYFLGLVILISVIALWEFYGLAKGKGFSPFRCIGIIAILAVSVFLYFRNWNILQWIFLFFPWLVFISELFRNKKNALVNCSVTLSGVLYISLLLSFILIREAPVDPGNYTAGGWLVMLILVTIWLCDTAAYLFGIRFGRHALFKRISPHKTWEGAVAGFMVSLISAVGLGALMLPHFTLEQRAGLGFLIGIIGQFSDLVESMFKRDSGVKDSSRLIPGHGGMLDRFDSPVLIGPAVWLFLVLQGLT